MMTAFLFKAFSVFVVISLKYFFSSARKGNPGNTFHGNVNPLAYSFATLP